MAKISLGGGTFEGVEVDLWGSAYKTVQITRSVQADLDKRSEKFEKAAESENRDQMIKAMAEVLDVRLAAVNGAGKPSALIVEKWKADELSLDQLLAFTDDLQEAEAPPT